MDAPLATYRIQLNKSFGFNELKAILPYLHQLGISHIYASPIFQAKQGSAHGYDVVNPNKISEELGGESAFRELIKEVKAFRLGWLQDIVPNHASYSLENKKVYDLWEKGVCSTHAAAFDINWDPPLTKLRGKVLLPFLAQPYQKCLKKRLLSLIYDGGFKVRYGELELPVNKDTSEELSSRGSVKEVIEQINNDPQALDDVLSKQFYALSYWKTALKYINYRRFFDIIDLIGLRMESLKTFQDTHRLIFELTIAGVFSGLRVDHIDGLYEPYQYLYKLREKLPNVYLIVEKILTSAEHLQSTWPVEGTTGYDFLNFTNKLFIKSGNQAEIQAIYTDFTGNTQTYDDLLYTSKKHVTETSFMGDIRNLALVFNQKLQNSQYNKPYCSTRLTQAIVELFACFPNYRTYLSKHYHDAEPLRIALKLADQRNRALREELSAISFLLEQSENNPAVLHALMRLQQFTGAVMAKGFEDTTLYRYNKLLSLNDVGVNPAEFGFSTSRFHEFNVVRQQNWPLTLNTLSTHDTKRGEDVRARLNIISEIPCQFKNSIQAWRKINIGKKRRVRGNLAPDANEEFYLYQTLLGAYPWETSDIQRFTDRVRQHMVKALREAKINSSWLSPNLPYEEGVTSFISEILDNHTFLEEFLPLQKRIAYYGFFNTLAQTLLKVTCPGIPDFYQGTELWDLTLVDPDNRQTVDFEKRQKVLLQVKDSNSAKVSGFLQDISDAKAKLYLIYNVLEFRRKHRLLFEKGEYFPMVIKGRCCQHVVAFCRKAGQSYAIIAVARFPTDLLDADKAWGVAAVDWADTYIVIPEGAPLVWTEALTAKTLKSQCGRLSICKVLGSFPVALLFSGEIYG